MCTQEVKSSRKTIICKYSSKHPKGALNSASKGYLFSSKRNLKRLTRTQGRNNLCTCAVVPKIMFSLKSPIFWFWNYSVLPLHRIFSYFSFLGRDARGRLLHFSVSTGRREGGNSKGGLFQGCSYIIIRIYVDSKTDVPGVKYSSISILYFKSVEKLNIPRCGESRKINKLITNLVSSNEIMCLREWKIAWVVLCCRDWKLFRRIINALCPN